jgi:hypothetical protein
MDEVDRALTVLLGRDLEPVVDMVARRTGPDRYEVLTAEGHVAFARADGGYERLGGSGADPLACRSPAHLAGIEAERADPCPPRSRNAYPFAFEQVAQLFDHPAAPDLCVLHSAAHNWEDQGGHRGEHGALGVVQARAPFVVAGRGVARHGMVERAARLVDVGPTLAALVGCAPRPDGTFLAGQDGAVLHDVLDDGTRPRHVVGFLWDGANANVVYDLAARGEAPNVARLIGMGTAYRWGAMAALPTVTLANHTTILTGRFPGRHGILHNAWYDRATGEQVITNSQATWPWAMRSLLPGVESLHDAVHRSFPDAFTVSSNEPCDLHADYSTFDWFRSGDVPPIPSSAEGIPHSTERFVRPSKDYAWSTVVDHLSVEQVVGIWSGEYQGRTFPLPRFTWCNLTLTDSAFHAAGPLSEMGEAAVRDSDARVGEVLAAVERAGVFDDTAFVLVADHGMQQTDPSVRGDWDEALRAAGIRFRDEGYSFLYLGDG